MAVFGSPSLGQYVDSFVSEVEDDLSAPGQSRFQEGMQTIKKNVLAMEEVCPVHDAQLMTDQIRADLCPHSFPRHCPATRAT